MSLLPAPSAAPFVNITEVTTSKITIMWGRINCIDQNGDITGYKMRYWVEGSESKNNPEVSVGATKTTIAGLDSATKYSIEVAAMNSVGIGVYSRPIIATTKGKYYNYVDNVYFPCFLLAFGILFYIVTISRL